MARLPVKLACLLIGCLSLSFGVASREVPGSLLQELFDKIAAEQFQETVPYKAFETLYRKKGVYASYIKQYFRGSFEMAEARRLLSLIDNNMFATAWVTSSLLEAHLYAGTTRPSDEQIINALNTFDDHHNLNAHHNTSVMTFWEQRYNMNTSYYECTPANLLDMFATADKLPMPLIEKILADMGLSSLAEAIKQIIDGQQGYLHAFHIPPDFDDTFVNLGLGAMLYSSRSQLPKAWSQWQQQNTNLTSVFDAVKRYAYRPFSSDPNVNSIDPRTYYWIRSFLDLAKSQGKDVTLIPTWIQNIDEMRIEHYKGVSMPFQVNNVDVTVSANTVYGLTAAVLSGLVSASVLDDPVIESVYHNTSAMIAHQLTTNMTSRPDLALLYYPSQIEFDWFVARTVDLLETAQRKGKLPKPVMQTVYTMLKNATEGAMTQYILSQAKHDDRGGVYFDDFLGDGDVTHDNKTLIRGEDRIFTTAMAANALLYTWTSQNESAKSFTWKQNTPATVKSAVDSSIKWLTENVLGDNFDPWNAFFSGSFKGLTTIPSWYPANRFEFLNGTVIHDWTYYPKGGSYTVVLAVEGHVPQEQYEQEIKELHFGRPTITVFNGYNSDYFGYRGFFPFWSSPAHTYSSALIAFSRYNNIVQ